MKTSDSGDMSDQKSSPDWLPAGWTAELKVRKNGKKDKYYTDPVSGYVFRSLKDAHRYLKTGDLGRLAFKPKDKDQINVELGDDKLSSCAGPEEPKLEDYGTNRQIIGKESSELDEIVKDEQILESACAADPVCLPEHTSDHSREGAAASTVNLPEAKGVKQREGKSESTTHKLVSAPVTEAAFPEKPPLENGVERPGNIRLGTKKSKGKGEPGIPRRASKRLAGIDVDPGMELKANIRTRRVAARQSGESEASFAENFSDLATPEEHAAKVENAANEKQELPVVWPPASLPMTEEPAGPVDMKPGSPPNLSLTDLWTDPCIEFAIKTLTGAIPIGDENKAYDNPGSPLDLPLGELWTDPCIEFAVKTLTGDIPVGDDLDIRDYFQQHVSSSETQRDNGLMLPNVGLNNFCPSDLSSQHFVAAEKPLYKQQDLIAPMLPHAGNVSLQNSGDSGLHRHVEGISGECSRPRVQ